MHLPRRQRSQPLQFERIATGAFRWVFHKQGAGPPLLLVHGLSGSVGWWRRNIPVLAEHYAVYAIELAGFASNRSGRPLPLRESADGIAALMDALELPRAHVVGHSMGAHTSLYLAATHAERVERLVLAAPSGLVRGGILPMGWRLMQATRYGALDMVPTILWDALRAGPLNLLAAARALLTDDVTDLLPTIHAPTLVLAGQHDTLVPPSVCELVAHAIPDADYHVLEGAGHNLMWDRASAFNDATLRFLHTARGARSAAPSAEQRPPTTDHRR